jgi:hypothetical protein
MNESTSAFRLQYAVKILSQVLLWILGVDVIDGCPSYGAAALFSLRYSTVLPVLMTRKRYGENA